MILWILRNQQVSSILNITSLFEKLPKEYQNKLNTISKLAFYALQEVTTVFELQQKFNKDIRELAIPVEQSYHASLDLLKYLLCLLLLEARKCLCFLVP